MSPVKKGKGRGGRWEARLTLGRVIL